MMRMTRATFDVSVCFLSVLPTHTHDEKDHGFINNFIQRLGVRILPFCVCKCADDFIHCYSFF